MDMAQDSTQEITGLKRWRLILGGEQQGSNGSGGEGMGDELRDGGAGFTDGTGVSLTGHDAQLDMALSALYDKQMYRYGRRSSGKSKGKKRGKGSASRGLASRGADLSPSAPYVAKWLHDIRELFPTSTVQMLQQDAISRLDLEELLAEREMLESVVPDVHLISTLLNYKEMIPEENKDLVRQVISHVVAELMAKLQLHTVQALKGALNKAVRRRHPRVQDINWDATIRKNLQHYQPSLNTIIPEELIGYGRKGRKLKDVILCIDQSGSMAESVIFASVFGAIMASMPALSTRLICFDTSVVDWTDHMSDPVDILWGVQLGGGTDINQAVTYGQSLVHRPDDTIIVVITDLEEGGDSKKMLKRFAELVESGVQVIVLLALSDDGAPSYDQDMAKKLMAMGICCFACTPDKFPDMMAAAINKQDMSLWVSQNIRATHKI